MCLFRKMGKDLFLDEDRMHVPLIFGSLTDEGFVSASKCYLRNSQMGESWRVPQQLKCTPSSHKTCLEIDFSHYSAKDQVWDCRLNAFYQHIFYLCNHLFTADLPLLLSSLCLHALPTLAERTPVADLTQSPCTWLGIQASSVHMIVQVT